VDGLLATISMRVGLVLARLAEMVSGLLDAALEMLPKRMHAPHFIVSCLHLLLGWFGLG
jgi:hypothetical protein